MSIRTWWRQHLTRVTTPPPDDDLSNVLRHIAPLRRDATRRSIANSPETRAFLESGLDLLHRDLLEHTGADFEKGTSSPLITSVSTRRVTVRARQRTDGVVGLWPTPPKHKMRWPHHARFAEDLIAYLFRLEPQRARLREINALIDKLPPGMTLHALIRQLTDVELCGTTEDRDVALRIAVQAATPRHETVRAYVAATYDEILPTWAGIYEKVGARYGLRLRPDYTWVDVAMMFDAVLEGVALRARCQSRPTRSSVGEPVISAMILALLPGLLLDYDGNDRVQVGRGPTLTSIPSPRRDRERRSGGRRIARARVQ